MRRNMSLLTRLSLAGITIALCGRTVAGQSVQRFSLQVSGLTAGLYGPAYRSFAQGFGGEAQVRYTPGSLSVGAGVQRTDHDFQLLGAAIRVRLAGPFFEPRYVLHSPWRTIAPYVSGRFSILEQSFDISNFRGSSTGITVNAGGGFLARLTVRTNLDLGMTYGYTQFRSFEMVDKQSTERFLGPTGSGSNLVARIGLAIGVRG
jgi:hypothetical protein